MHHADNVLPKVFSELIGTYVAILTGCEYAAAHHGHNYASLVGDEEASDSVLKALRENDLSHFNDEQQIAALQYVRLLCDTPAAVEQSHIHTLVAAGWSDGEILEIAQVVAMFSYFVRVINGVGIQLGNEKLGLY